ncbi:beta-ketoacyl-[acyl-carrier-protein] synthase family protein [Streptomyces viridochromogenes]|uniref:Putative 3-oxoacyl-[acyl-carrier-protein] synthase II n=1 Tax=Streptomyces viridochromogenes Tue57 TaxID=1160705 RepID=L8P629_STRVR|nr:beta-ketoacyl-[acyl-carrier-protein] synthase family protein [Streptomyces viridochromogenes]ELS50767.1 putative 3-oxoacyl-[acyl-carrier-protein] synthase II [Streptomyces viridochromogenes Tue57]
MAATPPPTVAVTVAVTGVGLVTPAGAGTASTWEGVCAGRSTAADDPELAGLPVPIACRVPDFDPHTHARLRRPWRFDRATQLLLAAAREALDSAGLDSTGHASADDDNGAWPPERTALVIGSAAGGIGTLEDQHRRLLATGPDRISPHTLPAYLPNMAAGHAALELGVKGPALHTSTACASGASAVITAGLLLAAGHCDIALAGGSDAMVTPLCSAAFAKMGALSRRTHDPGRASRPFDRDRDGFVLAEGSAVLVLEREADARARQARPLALLAGHATTTDAHHPVAPDPDGTGLERAVRAALAQAGAAPDEVDHINAHGTSTPLNDRVEAAVIRRLYGRQLPSVTSAKGVLGHTMGAAGAVEAALTVLSVAHGAVPPTANFTAFDDGTDGIDLVTDKPRHHDIHLALSHSLGFGGHNTVLAFRAA